MSKICPDSGTIQAFLDGELAAEKSHEVSQHLAACDACAIALADAEEESALVFAALDGELNMLVPTQRLWTKINDSIAVEKQNVSVWQKFRGYISIITANPSLAAAAVILIFSAVFALVLTLRPSAENSPLIAAVSSNTVSQTPAATGKTTTTAPNMQAPMPSKIENSAPRIERAAVRPTARQDENQKASNFRQAPKITNAGLKTPDSRFQTRFINAGLNTSNSTLQTRNAAYLPGEESYVKTIANLTATVDLSKNAVLKPSAQISFARDLAVVNDAILKMKAEVKKNPKNDSARQVLYSSYQNKIDLLNSVAQKNELMASLR